MGDDVELYYTVRPNPNHLGFLRLLDSNLNYDLSSGISKNLSWLSCGTDCFTSPVQNPAVATSGSQWLAGFEVKPVSWLFSLPSQLYVFSVNNNGTDNSTSRLDINDGTWGSNDHNLDLVWNGSQFLAVWERDSTATNHDISMALVDANGNVTLRQAVDISGSNETQPAVAL